MLTRFDREHESIAALKPVQNTLGSLHLPLCIGSNSPLKAQDEELAAGLILSPERCRGLGLSPQAHQTLRGLRGLGNKPYAETIIISCRELSALPCKRLRVRVSLLDTRSPAQRLTCGVYLSASAGSSHKRADCTCSSSACAGRGS